MTRILSERNGYLQQQRRNPLRVLINVIDIFIYTLKNLSVEPIVFIIYLGFIFGTVLQSTRIYRRICELYNGEGESARVDCNSITDNKDEDDVQMRNAEWSLFCALAYFIPAVFADTLLGAYGDRNGRKVNILIGIVGIAISEFGYLLVLSNSVHAPFWIVIIFCFVSGATGYIALIPASCNAYLADITEDSDVLTIRSGIFSVFQSLASVIGALVAGILSKLRVVIAIDIELGLYLVAFLYTLWRIPQKHKQQLEDEPETKIALRESLLWWSPKNLLREMWQLLTGGFATYKRRRIGHRRAFVFITVAAMMISNATSVETRISIVMNSYLFRETEDDALGWDQKDVGYWNAEGYAILIVGTLLGLYLFKQILRLRETTIILIALASGTARTLVIAFATEWWYMYVANACGLFSGLIQPAVISFVVQLIPKEEIGRIFSLFGISNDFAFIITYLVYSNVYRATQAWMPGFLFLLMSGVQAVAWLGMLWVHVNSILEGVGKEPWRKVQDIQYSISIIGQSTPPATLQKQNGKSSKQPDMKILDYALARRAASGPRLDDEWWHSVDDVRCSRGSFH